MKMLMSMQQISTMHYGRNSDYAHEVMRFPGLEMFIYGERFTKKRVNSCKNGWFQPSYEWWNLSSYGEDLQKWRQIHAKMSDFDLNLGRNLSYYGEDAWTDQKRPLYMDEKNISKLGTPIVHGRKYFFICGYMESIPQQPKIQNSDRLKNPITTRVFRIRVTYLCGFRDFICGYMESNIFLRNFVSQKGRW